MQRVLITLFFVFTIVYLATCLFICFFIFIIVYNSSLTFVAVVIRLLTDILFILTCIIHLSGGPLEKQRQLKSQKFDFYGRSLNSCILIRSSLETPYF